MDTNVERYDCYIVKSKQWVSQQYLEHDPIFQKILDYCISTVQCSDYSVREVCFPDTCAFLYDIKKNPAHLKLHQNMAADHCVEWMSKWIRYSSLKNRHVELLHQDGWLKATKTHLKEEMETYWKETEGQTSGKTRTRSVAGPLAQKPTDHHYGGCNRNHSMQPLGDSALTAFRSVSPHQDSYSQERRSGCWDQVCLPCEHGWMRRTLTGGPTGISCNRRGIFLR